MHRRAFLRTAAIAPAWPWALRGLSPARGRLEGVRAEGYLAAALDVARWIGSTQTESPYGPAWPADAADPASVAPDLYHGVCGPTLFATALHRAAEEEEQRALARELLQVGCRYLARAVAGGGHVGLGAGLYTGLAGIGFTLFEAARELEDHARREARAAALRTTDALIALAEESAAGSSWSDATDVISGNAGTGLFCLDVARRAEVDDGRRARSLELAAAAGRHLVAAAVPQGDTLSWPMTPDFPRVMPNFSHGTAGVAYFLARLFEETRDERFLDAARAGAARLSSLADERCLVHHHTPDGEELYYLGWCHGPAGTGRLFHLLARLTGDAKWQAWLDRSARSLIDTGIPRARPDGFWNNVGICCGSAGVAEFALDVHRSSGDPELSSFARELTRDLLLRGTRDEAGLRWEHAEHRVKPELLQTQTGYMQGAAGVGILLLRWVRFERGGRLGLRLPDSPF